MKRTVKMFVYLIIGILVSYTLILIMLYFFQEKLIFFPEKIPQNYVYKFNGNFEEKWIETSDGYRLNALYFKTDSSKGAILYLHGNAGALNSWGDIAGYYTSLHYDILIPDYRGFGKSTGEIYSEKQVFDDAQRVYNFLKQIYSEDRIIIIGYSIGTGPATYLASKNKPQKLVLQAPYFNLSDLVNFHYKVVPSFLLKYPFKTNVYISQVKAPIAIFHGNKDQLIYCESSEKLYNLCKPIDKFYLLTNQEHGGLNENIDFRLKFEKFITE